MPASEIKDGIFKIYLEHPHELHYNTIVLVLDQLTGNLGADNPLDYPKFLAAQWEIRIGNSPIWHENPICPGELELKSTYNDVFSDSSHVGNIMVPSYGFRKKCNMLGTFTHFIAYSIPTESVTVCDVAVLGTKYIRDEPLEEIVEIEAVRYTTLTVPHVHAADTIGNVLAIDLRQSADFELSFVQLTNGATETEVLIDTTGLAVGNYTM